MPFLRSICSGSYAYTWAIKMTQEQKNGIYLKELSLKVCHLNNNKISTTSLLWSRCMLFLACYWTLQMACNVSKFTKFGLTLAFIHVYSGLDSSLLMVKGFWRQGSPPLS